MKQLSDVSSLGAQGGIAGGSFAGVVARSSKVLNLVVVHNSCGSLLSNASGTRELKHRGGAPFFPQAPLSRLVLFGAALASSARNFQPLTPPPVV